MSYRARGDPQIVIGNRFTGFLKACLQFPVRLADSPIVRDDRGRPKARRYLFQLRASPFISIGPEKNLAHGYERDSKLFAIQMGTVECRARVSNPTEIRKNVRVQENRVYQGWR